MRIVQLVDSLAVGGTERMVVHLSCGLQASGHDVAVVCLRSLGALAEPLHRKGIPTHALGKPEGLHWASMAALRDFLSEFKADVVHTHNPLVHHYGAVAGRLARVPQVVSTVHGIGNINGIGKSEVVFGASCLVTNHIVAVCQMARDVFAAHPLIAKNKLRVVYNGIPLEPYLSVPPRAGGGPFVFGAVGRLVPVKDHATLLAAFQQVAHQHPECRLEFLGDGVLRQDLEQKAVQLGIASRVVFHGERAETRDFYENIDVFVMSSLSEGLPMTLLEAMAAGRPIVSTNVGGIPEMVEGSQSGWLCPPSQPKMLAQALSASFTAGDRLARGARAREYVQKHGSLDAMVRGYEAVFSETSR
jgi:glycosyltransferase involved in cell wall biosynthesis